MKFDNEYMLHPWMLLGDDMNHGENDKFGLSKKYSEIPFCGFP